MGHPHGDGSKVGSNPFGLLYNAEDFPDIQSVSRKRKPVSYELFFNQQKSAPGKYLLVENATEGENLSKISIFGIYKALQSISKDFASINRTRSGSYLVLTKNEKQTNNLLKVTKFENLVDIKVTLHPTLNSSKGIIYCREIMTDSVETITKELKNKGVINTYRIKKKNMDGELVDTPLHIFTFNNPTLPTEIKIAMLNCKVRMYIPDPMRCAQCQRYGHTKKRCFSVIICGKCSEKAHENQCIKKKCTNCSGEHYSFDKSCPKYLYEKKVIETKTVEGITFGEARKKVQERYPNISNIGQSYKEAASTNSNKNQQINNDKITNTNIQPSKPNKNNITFLRQDLNIKKSKHINKNEQMEKETTPDNQSLNNKKEILVENTQQPISNRNNTTFMKQDHGLENSEQNNKIEHMETTSIQENSKELYDQLPTTSYGANLLQRNRSGQLK